MTHDLIKNVLTGFDAIVHKIVVTELKDDTFYAVIWLEREGRGRTSRPSRAAMPSSARRPGDAASR